MASGKKQYLRRAPKPCQFTTAAAVSEVHFEIANNTVFAADNYTTSKSHQLTLLSALMLAGIIIMWIALFMVYLRKLYSLESSNKTLYDITTKDPLTGAYNFETFKKKLRNYSHKRLKIFAELC